MCRDGLAKSNIYFALVTMKVKRFNIDKIVNGWKTLINLPHVIGQLDLDINKSYKSLKIYLIK